MRVLFTAPFRWRAKPNVVIRYPAETNMQVPRRCAVMAIAAGVAVEVQIGKATVDPRPDKAATETQADAGGGEAGNP